MERWWFNKKDNFNCISQFFNENDEMLYLTSESEDHFVYTLKTIIILWCLKNGFEMYLKSIDMR